MTSLLFGIAASALLSVTSLLVVLFRVSPLSAPAYAVPAFFVSVFLSVSSVGALLLLFLWRVIPFHTWDLAKIVSVSVRQGLFLGFATCVLILFQLLGVLTWWIALLIYGMFVLVEVALDS